MVRCSGAETVFSSLKVPSWKMDHGRGEEPRGGGNVGVSLEDSGRSGEGQNKCQKMLSEAIL